MQHGAESLLGPFPHRGGFDAPFETMEVQSISGGEAVCELTVEAPHCNAYGTLHGGAIGTLVDILGTLAIISVDHTRPGVSLEINVSYLAAAKEGTRVTATGKVLKIGGRIGFTEVELRDEGGQLLAVGRHTKAFPGARRP